MTDAPVAVRRSPRDRRAAAGTAPRGAACAAAALALGLAACASGPPQSPPDTDATPEGAQTIALGEPHTDTLDCSGTAGPDCVDWIRFPATGPGSVAVSVAPHVATGEAPPAPAVPFELVVTGEDGGELGHASAGADAPIAVVQFETKTPTVWLVAVRVPPGTPRAVYDLSWQSQAARGAAPPAPAAAGQTKRWAVLEVEAQGNLLIDGGRRDGLRPGQRGRLLDGARTLGRVVVSEVFEEGARARVDGPLSGAITPDTVAEIEVPATSR